MDYIFNTLQKLWEMTALSDIGANPWFIVMYLLAFVLLYLGIVKKYEPLLLIPIAFGVLLANFPQAGKVKAVNLKLEELPKPHEIKD